MSFQKKIGWEEDETVEKKKVEKPKVNKKESKKIKSCNCC